MKPVNNEDMVQWYSTMIDHFNLEYEKLSDDQKKKISNLDNFSGPCHILSLTLVSPNWTFIFILRNEAEIGKGIDAYGPVQPYDLEQLFIDILEDKRLYTSFEEQDMNAWGKTSFGAFLELEFSYILEKIKNSQLHPSTIQQEVKVLLKKIAPLNSFEWIIQGNLFRSSPQEFASSLIKKSLNENKTEEKRDSAPQPQEELISGYLTYFYPHVWIGDVPKFDFKTRLDGLFIFPVPKFSITYKGIIIVISQRGAFFVGESNKESCLRLINEIIGTFILFGYRFDIVREVDIGIANISKENKDFRSFTHPVSITRNWQASQEFDSVDEWTVIKAIKLDKEKIVQIINKSEEITKNPEMGKNIVFLAQSSSHIRNAEYLESFVLSWLIIERYLRRKFSEFLSSNNITGKRKKKIENWSIDTVIEQLAINSIINDEEYDQLIQLKSKRNDVNHEGYLSTKADAEKCYDFAESLLKRSVEIK